LTFLIKFRILINIMSDTKQNNNSEWRDRELGALWVRQGKGQKYLSGHLEMETMPGMTEKVRVVVFSNKGKAKNEQAPDYVVYRSADREDDASSTTTQSAATTRVEAETEEEELPAAF
jgi:hypothetical protein